MATDATTLIRQIERWGDEKGLHADAGAQFEKLGEELGELIRWHGELCFMEGVDKTGQEADTRYAREKVADAIGDMRVVLIQIAAAHGIDPIESLEEVWEEIRNREGETVDGIFHKETS